MQKAGGLPGMVCELGRTTGWKQEQDGRLRSIKESGRRSGDDMERAGFWFVFRP